MQVGREHLIHIQTGTVALPDKRLVGSQVFQITHQYARFPSLAIDNVQPVLGEPVGGILLFSRTGIDGCHTISTQATGLGEVGVEERLAGHEPVLVGIFGMQLTGEGRDALLDFVDVCLFSLRNSHLCARYQREHLQSATHLPMILFVVDAGIQFRHTTVLDVLLALPVGTVREVL